MHNSNNQASFLPKFQRSYGKGKERNKKKRKRNIKCSFKYWIPNCKARAITFKRN